VAGVVIIGALAVFVTGLAVGMLMASIALRRDDRRARLIGKIRGTRTGNLGH
jgi:hypothetical protein